MSTTLDNDTRAPEPAEVTGQVTGKLATVVGSAASVATADKPVVSRSGAQKGNRNRMRHALRSSTGRLPPKCGWIKSLVAEERRMFQQAILERKGVISLLDALCLQSALRWAQHAWLCQRWLRLAAETMSDSDRLAYSREVARASTERDRCVERLDLASKPDDIWDVLDTPAPSDASAAVLDDLKRVTPDEQNEAEQQEGQP